jgi:hypothetical protein
MKFLMYGKNKNVSQPQHAGYLENFSLDGICRPTTENDDKN